MLFPAVTGSGESVLVKATSADATTWFTAEPDSAPGLGSGVADTDEAVLVIRVPAATPEPTCTTRVMVAGTPAATTPSEHVTVAVPAQDPIDGVAETNVVPAGSGSLTLTFWASDGPLFMTVIV